MRELGVDSSVVNLSGSEGVAGLFEDAGFRVWSLNLTPNLTDIFGGVKRLQGVLKQAGPDIVQGWMYHANMLASLTSWPKRARGRSIPILWNIRRGLDDYAQRSFKTRCVIRVNAMLSRSVEGIVYCSLESKEQHESFGFHADSSLVLENGFDTDRFMPRPDQRRAFRARYRIGDDEVVIGNIARFDVAKGHTFLIEAFGKILKVRPNARLVLIGRGVEESNHALRLMIEQHDCCNRVLLLGEQGAVANILPAFDIYCSSSISEGFPNAISEALSCGIVCVVTDTGASKQLVGGIGRVVQSRNAEKLAEALLATIDDGSDARLLAGGYGRQRIIKNYGLRPMAERYYCLYRQVLAPIQRVQGSTINILTSS
jgi:glycosyltransferase involved in cell wall biosynthesis